MNTINSKGWRELAIAASIILLIGAALSPTKFQASMSCNVQLKGGVPVCQQN